MPKSDTLERIKTCASISEQKTVDYKIKFGKKSSIKGLRCETKASWDNTLVAKSLNELLLYRNEHLVHWRSKKQGTVVSSSTKSELETMLKRLKEIIWTSKILKELRMTSDVYKELKCDNLNAVKLASAGNFKTRTKILNRKYHSIREYMDEHSMKVSHVPKENIMADC